ncbi:MAG: EamA family transporter [Candidatus Bathyarchaeia archaeon]
MTWLSYVLVSVLLGGLGQVFWKMGLKTVDITFHDIGQIIKLLMNEWMLAGIVCYMASTLLWWMALKEGPISRVYPFISLNFVILAIIGYFLFGEHLGFLGIVGIVLIIAGITLLAYSYNL